MGQGLCWEEQVTLTRVLQRQNFSSNEQDHALSHCPNLALKMVIMYTVGACHPMSAEWVICDLAGEL